MDTNKPLIPTQQVPPVPIPDTPPTVAGENDFTDYINKIIATAGSIKLTQEQKDVLYAPVKEEDVEITPDGRVYMPWMEYVSRLRDAFGMNWGLIPQGMPKVKGNLVIWGFYLVVGGKLAGFAMGEQTYYASNPVMTWGDACEGAKSNALTRLCKGIGIGLELWKPSFTQKWQSERSETYYDKTKGKNLWRKKKVVDTKQPVVTTPEAPEPLFPEPEPPQIQIKSETSQTDKTPEMIWKEHLATWNRLGIDYKAVMRDFGIEKVNPKTMHIIIDAINKNLKEKESEKK